ncbi:MAG: hypothetical protein U9M94_02070 [Patescibacteria group bacterium]|nr:hypothetical protein [Patescibacteria group bacterium]
MEVKEKLDYYFRPGVATELLRARQKKQKELEETRPYLKSMKLEKGATGMIHVIPPKK